MTSVTEVTASSVPHYSDRLTCGALLTSMHISATTKPTDPIRTKSPTVNGCMAVEEASRSLLVAWVRA